MIGSEDEIHRIVEQVVKRTLEEARRPMRHRNLLRLRFSQ